MPEPHEVLALLELEREQERRFAAALPAAEPELDGTPDEPSAKDTFAHAIGAKWHMHDALSALRTGTERHPSHDREDIFPRQRRPPVRGAGGGRRVAAALAADVGALDAETLGSAPPWIDEATLADEIIQQCATHGMVLMFEVMSGRGGADDARAALAAFVAGLPVDASALQRSRALYNLACLDVRTGREDEAVDMLAEALRLRPALAAHVRDDPELAPVRARVLA